MHIAQRATGPTHRICITLVIQVRAVVIYEVNRNNRNIFSFTRVCFISYQFWWNKDFQKCLLTVLVLSFQRYRSLLAELPLPWPSRVLVFTSHHRHQSNHARQCLLVGLPPLARRPSTESSQTSVWISPISVLSMRWVRVDGWTIVTVSWCRRSSSFRRRSAVSSHRLHKSTILVNGFCLVDRTWFNLGRICRVIGS